MFKHFPKILIAVFVIIFLLQLAGLIFLSVSPLAGQAVEFKPQTSIGQDFIKNTAYQIPKNTEMIAVYIRAIYKYAIAIVGIVATVVMMFGGVLWLTAGGNPERVNEAKAWITAALTGLVLALSSYLILTTVNPALVNFNIREVKSVKPIDSCITKAASYECGEPFTVITGYDKEDKPIEEVCCGTGCSTSESCKQVTSADNPRGFCLNKYWACQYNPGAAGTCSNNKDSDCPPNTICNMAVNSILLAGKSECVPRGGDNYPCAESADCQIGFRCDDNGRCKTLAATEWSSCDNSGNCPSPLKCVGRMFGSYAGLCFDGSPGDSCCSNSDCLSNNCSIGILDLCTRAAIESATYRCY